MDFLWLFDAEVFMPRSHCGPWATWMIVLSNISNLTIAAAYLWIPFWIYKFWQSKKDVLPYSWLLIGFALFIGVCGLHHIFEVCSFYFPAYRMFLLNDAILAILSACTAVMVPFAVRFLSEFAPPEELAVKEAELEKIKLRNQRQRRLLDYYRSRRHDTGHNGPNAGHTPPSGTGTGADSN